jgi:putative transposase
MIETRDQLNIAAKLSKQAGPPQTDTARRQHARKGPRCPSDLRNADWALIEALFPAARSGGRRRTTCLRAVMDAIM